MNELRKFKLINGFTLKILAIVFMTIDHIGFIFGKDDIYRIIGRLAFPLFAFLIYQGYTYTRNRLKYFLRLFLFGVAIELVLELLGLFMVIPLTSKNIFLLLSFGVLGLMILDGKINILGKVIILSYLAFLTTVLNFDYYWYGYLFILSFWFYPRYFYVSIILQFLLTYGDYRFFDGWDLQFYSLFAWLLIGLYNNKRGYPGLKYLFYVYYPLHLGVLYLIAMYL